jgi:hypothetical protein
MANKIGQKLSKKTSLFDIIIGMIGNSFYCSFDCSGRGVGKQRRQMMGE